MVMKGRMSGNKMPKAEKRDGNFRNVSPAKADKTMKGTERVY